METKRCRRCEKSKPVDDFRIRRRSSSRHTSVPTTWRVTICRICEVEVKAERQFRTAFVRRRWQHADRLGLTTGQLEEYGWVADARANEMRAYFRHGFCPGCIEDDGEVHYFRDMRHGLRDMTIDIRDPKLPPWWGGNTQWLCQNCNNTKHHHDGIEHSQRRQAEREFERAESEPIAGQLSLLD